MLKKLNFYKINMKIWDSKEKVARKVKYYRLTNSVCTEDLSSLGKSGCLSVIGNLSRTVYSDKSLFPAGVRSGIGLALGHVWPNRGVCAHHQPITLGVLCSQGGG